MNVIEAKVVKVPQQLFTPIRIGSMEVKNRIVMASMATSMHNNEDMDGLVSDRLKNYFAARAEGGAGLIMLGTCSVDGRVKSETRLSLYDDRFIPGLKELVDVVHAHGAKIGIQLQHPGRQASSRRYKVALVAPSAIPWSPSSGIPYELSIEEIQELIAKFAEAARRAKDAGFDLVEIHGAHGYLVSEFLSPQSNQRDDEYGGDTKGRARFVVDIIKRIRRKVGADFPVSCRINGADYVPGGHTLEDAKDMAPLLVAAGLNLLSVSAGVYGSFPNTVPPYDMPQGCYLHLAAGVKGVVSVPVVAVGRIKDPWLAEDILLSGKADLVALGRVLWTDPQWPRKVFSGEFDEIRWCIGCNQGCVDRKELSESTCLVNPEMGKEKEFEIIPTPRSKKVLVIGGGLAGLEVARVAARRGHKVTLCEEHDELGGQWVLASAPPGKQEFMELVSYLRRQLEKLGVRIELGKKVTASVVEKMKPDVAVVATGAKPLIPFIAGLDKKEAVTAWDVLKGEAMVGERVLVVGGGAVGLETAEFLALQGKKVIVVEMLEHLGGDMGRTRRHHLRQRLNQYGVELLKSTKVKQVTREEVTLIRNGREETLPEISTVVLAIGTKASNEIAGKIRNEVPEVYIIGDASQPGKGLDAMLEAAEVGRRI